MESVAQQQRLPVRRQRANTFQGLFAEGNVLYLLTFQIASESKQVSLSFFSFSTKQEESVPPGPGWAPNPGLSRPFLKYLGSDDRGPSPGLVLAQGTLPVSSSKPQPGVEGRGQEKPDPFRSVCPVTLHLFACKSARVGTFTTSFFCPGLCKCFL